MSSISRRIAMAAIGFVLLAGNAGRVEAGITVNFAGTMSLTGGNDQDFVGASITGQFSTASLPLTSGSATITSFDFAIVSAAQSPVLSVTSSDQFAYTSVTASYQSGANYYDKVTLGLNGSSPNEISVILYFTNGFTSTNPSIISTPVQSNYNYNGHADGYITQAVSATPEPATVTLSVLAIASTLGWQGLRSRSRKV